MTVDHELEETVDHNHEVLLKLAKAARILEEPPSPCTLWRWRTRGVLVRGERIRLECVRVGGQWYTTRRCGSTFNTSSIAASGISRTNASGNLTGCGSSLSQRCPAILALEGVDLGRRPAANVLRDEIAALSGPQVALLAAAMQAGSVRSPVERWLEASVAAVAGMVGSEHSRRIAQCTG